MHRLIALGLSAVLLWTGSVSAADAPPPELASVVEKQGGATIVGEVKFEDSDYIEIRDLSNGNVAKFRKSDVKSLRRNLTDRAALEVVGLANYLAWRVASVLPKDINAKVALVEGETVYLAIGKASGIEPGSELTVVRGDVEIKDPDTGKVLGRRQTEVAKVKVDAVEDELTKAAIIGEPSSPLKVGDVVKAVAGNRHVAVLPLVNASGKETVETKRLADELAAGLVASGVSVVERGQLDRVLGELKLEGTSNFDSAKAQSVGKQLGVYAIVIGSLSPRGKFAEAQFRVVRVATGEILATASQRVSGSALAGVVSKNAPEGASKFRGHSYQVFFDVLSWSDAKQKCEEMGGHLATPESLEENAFIVQLALQSGRKITDRDAIWIGATDEAREGDWRFVTGGPVTNGFWSTIGKQPNNGGNKGVGEHYALAWLRDGRWSDQPNVSTAHTAFFVCEWDDE